jgi:hypothetical protein
MNPELKRLAARRAHLVGQCAHQRAHLAAELAELRAPFGPGALRTQLAGLGGIKLALAGAALGLAIARPRRLLSMAAAGLSLWRTARSVLPMLAR